MISDYRFMREQAEKYRILELSSSFHSRNQDFPNTDQAVEALEAVCRANNWDMENIDNLSNAHAVAVRHGLYEPLSQEQIRASVAGPEPSYRPTPPPMLRGGNPDMSQPTEDLHTMPLDQLRKRILTHSGQNSGAADNGAGKSELHHTGQEFQSASLLGAWRSVFDGRESILPARGKKISYGLGAGNWITPARAATSEQDSLCSTPARAPNRNNGQTRERSSPGRNQTKGDSRDGSKTKTQAVS